MTKFRLALIAGLLTGCSDDATSDIPVHTSTTTDAAADTAAAADTSAAPDAAPDAADASAAPDVPDVAAADVTEGDGDADGGEIEGEIVRCARQTAALTGSAETDYRAFLCYDPAPRTCSIVSGQA